MRSIERLTKYKVFVSLAFGLLGFFVNFYPLNVSIPPHTASFVWGLVFPLLISLSWGWKYGLLSATLGMGAQTMWFLWLPKNGWAPFVAIPFYTLWIVWHGWCAKKRRKGILSSFYGAEIPFRILYAIVLSTIFSWSFRFNPSPWAPQMTLTTAPPAFVNFIQFKCIFEGFIVLLLADVLLNFGVVKKALLLEEPSKVKTGYIISGALLLGLISWLINGIASYMDGVENVNLSGSISNQTLADTLILNVPPHEILSRISILIICLLSGVLISKYLLKYKESELAREEAYTIVNKSNSVAFLWKNTDEWPVEFVTQNVQGLTGYSADDFVAGNVSYAKTIHPEDLERVSEEVAYSSRKEDCYDFEHEPYRIVTKDNKLKWISDKTQIRRDNQGRITHYQGIVEDITIRKQTEEEKEQLIVQLQKALDKVKLLSGFLPICASCKKIRNDQGYWTQIESYIKAHSEVEFSHGICPDCANKLYPEFAIEEEK